VSGRAAGLVAGYLLDAVLGDPASWHPVSGFGSVAAGLERRLYADSRPRGAGYTAALVGTTAGVGMALDRGTRRRPLLHAAVTAAATWAVLGGRSLAREADLVHGHLVGGDLDAAREQVTHLVGRDPSALEADGIARATVESLAENTSDAVVAPLFWGALLGPAGLLGYRAVNTLDAMVGHRCDRYVRFGWASARLDDLANLLPARFTALLTAVVCPMVGGRAGSAVEAWRRDAARHPSPNAGPVESAFAGALGITLGGVNTYGDVVEDRGALGSGRLPTVADIPRATRLARLVAAAALLVTVTTAGARSGRRR
jgi:adenosylcobinamide-phosphate synthase